MDCTSHNMQVYQHPVTLTQRLTAGLTIPSMRKQKSWEVEESTVSLHLQPEMD